MESKRKNIYITIFVITTIVAACAAVYFAIVGNKKTEDLQAQINEMKTNNKTEGVILKEDNTVDGNKNLV